MRSLDEVQGVFRGFAKIMEGMPIEGEVRLVIDDERVTYRQQYIGECAELVVEAEMLEHMGEAEVELFRRYFEADKKNREIVGFHLPMSALRFFVIIHPEVEHMEMVFFRGDVRDEKVGPAYLVCYDTIEGDLDHYVDIMKERFGDGIVVRFADDDDEGIDDFFDEDDGE